MLRDRIHELRDEIERIARRHRAVRVRLFGSVARGEDSPDSDVDFLVEFEDRASLFDVAGLKVDLEDLLGRKVDVIDEDGLEGRRGRSILEGALAL